MQKVLGLAVITVLLVGFASCTPTSQNPNYNASPTATTTTPTPGTPTPGTPTPGTPTATPTPTAPMTATVKGSNFKWQDDASGTPVTTIKVGGTVTWTIAGGRHRLERVAKSPENGCGGDLDASFNSVDLNSGQSVSRTFSTAGTFGYRCGIHGGTPKCNPPGGEEMWGVINVVP